MKALCHDTCCLVQYSNLRFLKYEVRKQALNHDISLIYTRLEVAFLDLHYGVNSYSYYVFTGLHT